MRLATDIARIEYAADCDGISNKMFDLTRTTIESLVAQGEKDAANILERRSQQYL